MTDVFFCCKLHVHIVNMNVLCTQKLIYCCVLDEFMFIMHRFAVTILFIWLVAIHDKHLWCIWHETNLIYPHHWTDIKQKWENVLLLKKTGTVLIVVLKIIYKRTHILQYCWSCTCCLFYVLNNTLLFNVEYASYVNNESLSILHVEWFAVSVLNCGMCVQHLVLL